MTILQSDGTARVRELFSLSGIALMIFAGLFPGYTWTAEGARVLTSSNWIFIAYAAGILMILSILLYGLGRGGRKEAAFLICFAALIALGIAIFRHSGDRFFLMTVCTIFSAAGIDYRKILKVYACLIGASFILMFILLGAGIVYDRVVEFSYGTGHALGAAHPNSLGRYFLVLTMLFWLLWGRNHMRVTAALSWICAGASYAVAMSRTAALLLVVFPFIVAFAERVSRKDGKYLRYTGNAMYAFIILSFAVTITLTVFFERGDTFTPDDYLWNLAERIQIPQDFREANGLSLFGVPLNGVSIDMGFARTLLYNGVLAEGVLIAGMLLLNRRLISEKRTDLLAVYFILIIYTYMEHILDVPAYGFIFPALFADLGAHATEHEAGGSL